MALKIEVVMQTEWVYWQEKKAVIFISAMSYSNDSILTVGLRSMQGKPHSKFA